MPNFTVTLNASILIQDASGAAPVQVTSKSVTDQQTAQDEFDVQEVTVPAGASDQAVDLSNFKATTIYMETTQPIVYKIVGAGTDVPFRKVAVITAEATSPPATLLFSNAGATDAQVFIALGSVN